MKLYNQCGSDLMVDGVILKKGDSTSVDKSTVVVTYNDAAHTPITVSSFAEKNYFIYTDKAGTSSVFLNADTTDLFKDDYVVKGDTVIKAEYKMFDEEGEIIVLSTGGNVDTTKAKTYSEYRRGKWMMWIVIIFFLVILLVVVGVAVAFFYKRHKKSKQA